MLASFFYFRVAFLEGLESISANAYGEVRLLIYLDIDQDQMTGDTEDYGYPLHHIGAEWRIELASCYPSNPLFFIARA